MAAFTKSASAKLLASAFVILGLTACGGGGGGGDDSGAGAEVSISGTAARGATLAGATVDMTCANGARLQATTDAGGLYTSNKVTLAYPCIGAATIGGLKYRGILFSGLIQNFTPLTDMLTDTALAAAASGSASLSLDQFLAKVRADSTFAASVSSPTAVASYRAAVLNVVKQRLIGGGMTEAEAGTIIAAAGNFDSTAFTLGSPLDKVLDNTAAVLQNTDGTVKAAILAIVQAAGNVLPTPASGGTGGTGGTSGAGG